MLIGLLLCRGLERMPGHYLVLVYFHGWAQCKATVVYYFPPHAFPAAHCIPCSTSHSLQYIAFPAAHRIQFGAQIYTMTNMINVDKTYRKHVLYNSVLIYIFFYFIINIHFFYFYYLQALGIEVGENWRRVRWMLLVVPRSRRADGRLLWAPGRSSLCWAGNQTNEAPSVCCGRPIENGLRVLRNPVEPQVKGNQPRKSSPTEPLNELLHILDYSPTSYLLYLCLLIVCVCVCVISYLVL